MGGFNNFIRRKPINTFSKFANFQFDKMDKLLLFFLVHFTCSIKADLFTKGSFDFVSEENYNCPESGNLSYMFSGVSVVKLNVSHLIINGSISAGRPFTNQMTLSLQLQQWQNDHWQDKIARVEKDQACTSVNLILGKPWLDMCRAAGIVAGKCPVAKGFYTVTNFIVDVASIPVLKMLSGRYKIIIQDHLNKSPMFCSEHIFKITQ